MSDVCISDVCLTIKSLHSLFLSFWTLSCSISEDSSEIETSLRFLHIWWIDWRYKPELVEERPCPVLSHWPFIGLL